VVALVRDDVTGTGGLVRPRRHTGRLVRGCLRRAATGETSTSSPAHRGPWPTPRPGTRWSTSGIGLVRLGDVPPAHRGVAADHDLHLQRM